MFPPVFHSEEEYGCKNQRSHHDGDHTQVGVQVIDLPRHRGSCFWKKGNLHQTGLPCWRLLACRSLRSRVKISAPSASTLAEATTRVTLAITSPYLPLTG